MRRKYLWLVFVGLFPFLVSSVEAQVNNKAKTADVEACSIEPPPQMSPDEQVKYRSPIRYVVVYDTLINNERRIEILLDEKCFNEQVLRTIFTALGRRYQSPRYLHIKVHTSLETIETPEERSMGSDSEDSRFAGLFLKHRDASFVRFNDGRESFVYTECLEPYKTKIVVIKE